MTTPTPAQQHVETLRRMRDNCDGLPHLADKRAALDYALAALEAVEGAPIATVTIEHKCYGHGDYGSAATINLTDYYGSTVGGVDWRDGQRVLIIPADAVEVSRGE